MATSRLRRLFSGKSSVQRIAPTDTWAAADSDDDAFDSVLGGMHTAVVDDPNDDSLDLVLDGDDELRDRSPELPVASLADLHRRLDPNVPQRLETIMLPPLHLLFPEDAEKEIRTCLRGQKTQGEIDELIASIKASAAHDSQVPQQAEHATFGAGEEEMRVCLREHKTEGEINELIASMKALAAREYHQVPKRMGCMEITSVHGIDAAEEQEELWPRLQHLGD